MCIALHVPILSNGILIASVTSAVLIKRITIGSCRVKSNIIKLVFLACTGAGLTSFIRWKMTSEKFEDCSLTHVTSLAEAYVIMHFVASTVQILSASCLLADLARKKMIQKNVQNDYEESAKSNDENDVSDTLGGVSITSDSVPHSRRFEFRLAMQFFCHLVI